MVFGDNLRHFHLEKRKKLFGKNYWTTKFFLVDSLKHSNPQSLSEFDENCVKSLKMEIFGIFVNFGVNLRHFHLEKRNKPFGKDYWRNNFFIVDP